MTGARPAVPILRFEKIDSTNAEALRRASAGDTGPLWIAANTQSAARGRRGRVWQTGTGNLAATYLAPSGRPAAEAALFSFVAGLAVADLLVEGAPGAEIRLKWPNDVLLNGRKAAGILLESAGTGGRTDWLAIGIGVNLASHPALDECRPGAPRPTSLAAEGAAALSPEAALAALDRHLAGWIARFDRDGFPTIRAAWLARAAHLGQRIGAGLVRERLEGTFEDVDATGALVLHTALGRRRIAAAELYFPE